MKCLSLLQPWASLVASTHKKIETRSWATPYRGQLAIAASKGFQRDDRALCADEPFHAALRVAGYGSWEDLPRGAIVAVATLTEVLSTERVIAWADHYLIGDEIHFGNYDDGRYAWLLDDVRALPEPIPCKGMLGLWDVPTPIAAQIYRQLAAITPHPEPFSKEHYESIAPRYRQLYGEMP